MNIFTQSNLLQDDQASVAFLQQRGIIHNPRQCANGHAMAIQYRNTGSDRRAVFYQEQPDLWAAYGGIQQMGYPHYTVNHTYNFIDPITGAHTQNVENSWKNAKTRHKKQHGTNRGMLDSHLCEWMWRQRNRNLNNNLFDKMLADISLYFPQ